MKPAIAEVALRHGVSDIRVFGSVARGTAGPESDVDLLVKMEPGRSMLDLARLWEDLRELLRCRVDVLSEGALTERDDDIRAEAVPL
ncbi:MAG: nucleotidyltransferase family protein [Actinomycetota bacterium]|nr:nucleotidyltransferase family protein [Actinomycetota bacterium]